MSPIAEWADMMVSATATGHSLNADPESPEYGAEIPIPPFPVLYQKASSSELQRLGRSHGEDLYIILADLDASGNAPAGKQDKLNVPGITDANTHLDVVAVIEYKQADERMARIEGLLRS